MTRYAAPSLREALIQIDDERYRQDAKWGPQNHPDGTARPGDHGLSAWATAKCKANNKAQDNWRDILEEEVYEAFAEADPEKLRHELIQVAAVAVAWIESIDRRTAVGESA
jgi:hypothetical protein